MEAATGGSAAGRNARQRAEAISDFRGNLEGWEAAAEAGAIPGGVEEGSGREVLSVDRRVCLDVLIAFGGPTESVRIEFTGGEVSGGEYFTTAPDYANSRRGVTVPLMLEEAERVAELLGLSVENGGEA